MSVTWWLRIVGAIYVFLFVAASILRIPIMVEGPPGVLDRAEAGDPTARFVVETWFTFGVYLGAVGIGMLVASARAVHVSALVYTVVAMEIGGIIVDFYKLGRGYTPIEPIVWVVIHTVIIVTGLLALQRHARQVSDPATLVRT